MRSVELFTGAGGLAIGVSSAGFHPELLVEWDEPSYSSLLHNQGRGLPLMASWNIVQADIRDVDYSAIKGEIDLVAGGPPCQPFSIGGKHTGHRDERNMWPEAIRAVRTFQPRSFLFENVRGLLRPAFATYLRYIILQLELPTVLMRPRETWQGHARRLERRRKTAGLGKELLYQVFVHPVDAADYGAPQKRRRVIIVGVRSDEPELWYLPRPTHARESLLWDKWVTKEYWERHKIAAKRRPEIEREELAVVNALRRKYDERPPARAWVTVRDVIHDLGEPMKRHEIYPNHRLWPGARAYPGHTGSQLDEPAKALKAGDHGVPGGENMLVREDGTVRYFTVREAARLQGFPNEYVFPQSVAWSECMRQLGNAVPVQLASCFAHHLATILSKRRATRGRAA